MMNISFDPVYLWTIPKIHFKNDEYSLWSSLFMNDPLDPV